MFDNACGGDSCDCDEYAVDSTLSYITIGRSRKKPVFCCECGQEIKAGQKCERLTEGSGYDRKTYYTCDPCGTIRAQLFSCCPIGGLREALKRCYGEDFLTEPPEDSDGD